MDKKSLVKILQNDISAVQSLIQGFDANGNVSPFEIEIALSKTKELLNELHFLKALTEENPLPRKPITPTAPEPIKVAEPKTEASIESQATPLPSFELIPETKAEPTPAVQGIETVSHEPIIEETTPPVMLEIEPVVELRDTETMVETEPPTQTPTTVNPDKPATLTASNIAETEIEQKTTTPTPPTNQETPVKAQGKNEIMADRFQNHAQSVNDMLSNFRKDQDLATLLVNRPVTDLKKAIKINDRIWYVNELFKKDTEAFNRTIDTINGYNNLDEALEYLFANFNWDQSQKSTISFLELVFRRFTR